VKQIFLLIRCLAGLVLVSGLDAPRDGAAPSATSSRVTNPEVARPGETVADVAIDLGRGPVIVRVPLSYDPSVPAPLIMLLHAYGDTGGWTDGIMQLLPHANEFGFLYVSPLGTTDLQGIPFWNATDACCDQFNSGVDDSGYLRALIEAVQAQFNVDARRIYMVGLSNGGMMAYRMACDHSDIIAAIVSASGTTWNDPGLCNPAEPVHVLEIHGTLDDAALYDGGFVGAIPYPGAIATIEQWATFAGCSLIGDTSSPLLDLSVMLPGVDTTVTRYATGCSPRGSGELWTIVNGGHIPDATPQFSRLILEFLYAHPKPVLCVADATPPGGNGVVNIDDLVAVLNSFGPCAAPPANCAADITPAGGNGVVNIDDLVAVLNAFGPCP